MKLWIAKNKWENSKCLFLYKSEPTFLKSLNGWVSKDEITTGFVDESVFPEITFENSPKEIQIILKDKNLYNIELNKEEIKEILFSLKVVNDVTALRRELITNLINKLHGILDSKR